MIAFARNSFDFAVSRNWLRHPGFRVLVPVVFSSVTNKHAAHLLESRNQIAALHATSRLAALRAAGMWPPDRSA